MALDIDFDPPLVLLAAEFNKTAHEFTSWKDALRDSVRKVVIPSFSENFASQGRPKWASLSPNYAKAKAAAGHGTKILQRIGGHRASPGRGGGFQRTRPGKLRTTATSLRIWEIDDETAQINPSRMTTFEAGRNYGIVHHFGRDRGGLSDIPARPYFVVQSDDEDKIVRVFEEWVQRKLVRGSRGRGGRSSRLVV